PGTEGGLTTYFPESAVMPIYDPAMKHKDAKIPLIVIAGKEYGSGSSPDWAAKGTLLLGANAGIAASLRRIPRSNLVNRGVLPLQFQSGQTAASIGLTGREVYTIDGIAEGLKPGATIPVHAGDGNGRSIEFNVVVRIDTPEELVSYKNGGILP